jgi:hypothetical protein
MVGIRDTFDDVRMPVVGAVALAHQVSRMQTAIF